MESFSQSALRHLHTLGFCLLVVGVLGVLGSFALFSSALSIGAGAVTLVSMETLEEALDIVAGERYSCTRPVHARK